MMDLKINEEYLNEALDSLNAPFKANYKKNYKNNGMKEGYILISDGTNLSPVVYYDERWDNMNNNELAEHLINMFNNLPKKDVEINNVLQKDYILSHVKPRLYSISNKASFDEANRIYKEWLDMLVELYVVVDSMTDCNGVSSIAITDSMLVDGLTIDELYEAALRNIEKDNSIQSMEEIMSEMGVFGEMPDIYDDAGSNMIVVSNRSKINGASSILSKQVQSMIAQKIGDEYIILPSSIHEVICVPANVSSATEMKEMVETVNNTVVDPFEKLTDSVYLYNHGELSIVA